MESLQRMGIESDKKEVPNQKYGSNIPRPKASSPKSGTICFSVYY